jgi:hypothetical protein
LGHKDSAGSTTTLPAPAAPPSPGWQPPPPPLDPDYGYDEDQPARYVSHPVRPVAQVAARVALWAMVAIGALTGILGFVRSGQTPEVTDDGVVDEQAGVPAPVAGLAEVAVREWLTASTENRDRINELFLQPPPLDNSDTSRIQVLRTTAIAGTRLDTGGYWTVTVAADVLEAAGEEGPGALPTTWYVEIGITGTTGGGLAAMTVPAIVGPPVLSESAFEPHAPSPGPPSSDDPIASRVEEFLNALLAGNGNPDDHMVDGLHIRAVTPAPFANIELIELSEQEITEGKSKGDVRVWAIVELSTSGGSVYEAGYELKVRKDIDRWKVVSVYGAPKVDAVEKGDGPTVDAPGDNESTTSTEPTTTTSGTPDTVGAGEVGSDTP